MAILTTDQLRRTLISNGNDGAHDDAAPDDAWHELRATRVPLVRVLVVSENPVFWDLIATELAAFTDAQFEAYGIDGPELSVEAYDRYAPHVVISDSYFEHTNIGWFDALAPLVRHRADVRLLIVDEQDAESEAPPFRGIVDQGGYVVVPRNTLRHPHLLAHIVCRVAGIP